MDKSNFSFSIKENAIADAEKSTLLTLVIGIAFGFIGLIGYPLTIDGVGHTLLFIGVLIAGAALITGFFTGTLFGIPKRNNDGTKDYTLNNSLVEIADWLTKIIVGLGLVNLKQVPRYLLEMGTYVNEAANVVGKSASVFTMCVVIYFSMLGLYIGYNYMRLVLSAKYKYADDNLMEVELKEAKEQVEIKSNEVEKQKDKVEILKNAGSKLMNIINQPAKAIDEVKEIALKNSSLDIANGNVDYVDEMIAKLESKLKDGLIKNAKINDPHKSIWGGRDIVNNRKLSAIVKQRAKGLYVISVTLESTDVLNHPLEDSDVVLFALHNTWDPPYYCINVENGKANLELFSYGSFTIGALCDKGKTELELDLAELPGVTKDFIEN